MLGGLAACGADETGRRTAGSRCVGMTNTRRFGIGIPFFFYEKGDIEEPLSQVGQEMPCVTAFADIYQNMGLSWESGTGVGLAGFEERYPQAGYKSTEKQFLYGIG